jgi:hypothetical protein
MEGWVKYAREMIASTLTRRNHVTLAEAEFRGRYRGG